MLIVFLLSQLFVKSYRRMQVNTMSDENAESLLSGVRRLEIPSLSGDFGKDSSVRE